MDRLGCVTEGGNGGTMEVDVHGVCREELGMDAGLGEKQRKWGTMGL